MEQNSITADEREGLSKRFNLSDAHTYHKMSGEEQRKILDRFPEIFRESISRDYFELEASSSAAFGLAVGQSTTHENLVCSTYSSSVSIMIVARYLKQLRIKTSLTSPTFDNLSALLRGEGVEVCGVPISELVARAADPRSQLRNVGAHFVVTPNNPTGELLSQTDVEALALECSKTRQILIFDQSFKAHVEDACFDYFTILERHGVNYIVIEDTGKLWPVRDLKASFIHASKSVRDDLRAIADDVLLNISPFILQVVEEYSKHSSVDDFSDLRSIIGKNRDHLRAALKERLSGLHSLPFRNSRVGVELVSFNLPSQKVAERSADLGLAILDVDKFYWNSTRDSKSTTVRLALMRDHEYFKEAVAVLIGVIESMELKNAS